MRIIHYGVSGEGFGHASRAYTIIKELDALVHVWTYGDGYEYFKQRGYGHLHLIGGLKWNSKKKISLLKSLWHNRHMLHTMREDVGEINRTNADLYITDYEPCVARAAKQANKTLISIDNQHRFSHCNLEIPFTLKMQANFISLFNKFLVPNPDVVVVSSFHHDEIRPLKSNTVVIPGILNAEEVTQDEEEFLLVYAPGLPYSLLNLIYRTGFKVKIYGLDDKTAKILSSNPNITCHNLSPIFKTDMVRCSHIIGSAGHQLITEAMYYQKPILCVPQNHVEQNINGYYVKLLGLGRSINANEVCDWTLNSLLHTNIITHLPRNGKDNAVNLINSFL